MSVLKVAKRLGEMALNKGGGAINWFPGHMAAATRAIRDRLKVSDLVVEVRDARIPLSSVNEDLQSVLSRKRRVIALNKKDLANPNIMNKWIQHFDARKQDCLSINAHSKNSVTKLLALVELKLKEVILRQPTLIVMVVGVPNVGKSTLINSIHQIASARFPVQEKIKRATVGPLPGVTQDIAGFKIAHQPSIYVLDSPGVLVPSIPDIETGLKLALTGFFLNPRFQYEEGFVYIDNIRSGVTKVIERLAPNVTFAIEATREIAQFRGKIGRFGDLTAQTAVGIMNPGAVKDSVVGEERLAQYLLAVLNSRRTPLHWRHMNNKYENDRVRNSQLKNEKLSRDTDAHYIEDLVTDVQRALFTEFGEFKGDLEDENDLETLIENQFIALQKAFRIPHKASDEARGIVSKKLLTLFRTGKLGPFTLDVVPGTSDPST